MNGSEYLGSWHGTPPWGIPMKRNVQQPARSTAPSSAGKRVDLLGEWIAHLRQRRAPLREEWARRMRESKLLPRMSEEEIFYEASSLFDHYVEVLENGSDEALQAYARVLSERVIPREIETHLLQAVEASRLMGASVIITGLSAEIAQTLVTLGVDLSKVTAVGDLQGGIEEAEHLLGHKVVKVGQPAGGDGELHASSN